MPSEHVERRYSNKIITGYVVSTGEYKWEKLITISMKKDGSPGKPYPVTITNSSGAALKGIKESLEPILGPMNKWAELEGQTLNIPVKMLLIEKEDGNSVIAENDSKPTIIKVDAIEPIWTDAEILAMKPKTKPKTTPMASEAPVVNNGPGDF